MKKIIKKKYSCFIYGEGKKDTDFLKVLINLEKFQYHTQKWNFNYGNASGSSAKVILEKCCREILGLDYDFVICFIDIDDLKSDYPKNWEDKKEKLEKKYRKFKIIWQIENAEDEYKKVIGNISKGKHGLNKIAKEDVQKFINSDFYKRILKVIKDREKELNSR